MNSGEKDIINDKEAITIISLGCIRIYVHWLILSAPPKIDKEIKDQQVEVGEQLKLKIPISGTGPFEVKVKKDNRELPESDRFKVTPFDDYVVMVLKGRNTC